jgi:hypothetical protein
VIPPLLGEVDQVIINPWSVNSLGTQLYAFNQTVPTAAAAPAANLLMLVPFWVPAPFTITKLYWVMGAAAGTVDMGVYDESANLLLSAANPSASGTFQVVDVTDTTIARGRYYMGLIGSTVTTLTFLKSAPAAGVCQAMGMLQQASITLPLSTGASPATFAKYAQAYVPLFGLQGYRALGP